MNKYYGKIGYAKSEETSPGIWTNTIIEKNYYGNVLRNNRKYSENTNSTNDNITLTNRISILSDSFITSNLEFIKYVTFQNSKWKIQDIEIKFPRLILTLGGVYNE